MIDTKNKLCESEPRSITVKCLCLDYDGTISPLDVSRADSQIPENTRKVLEQIRMTVPIIIITTKDISFVTSRTPFATAWSGICGLERKIGNKILEETELEKRIQLISVALDYARSKALDENVEIEEKKDFSGRTVAFCIDWRRSGNKEISRREAGCIAEFCKGLSLNVIRFEHQPFFDVYPSLVDKGRALRNVLCELNLEREGVMYIGDSELDNSAFKEANISLGVVRDDNSSQDLFCDYIVEFSEVGTFLKALLMNRLIFNSDFPMIKRNPRRRLEN